MIDRLVIKFIKLEKALVAQQLEIKVSNKLDDKYEDNHALFHSNGIDFADDAVWISKLNSPRVAVRMFDSNGQRDEYLDKVLGWISEELFSIPKGSGKLEIGRMCEVSDDECEWHQRKLVAIHPEKFEYRYYAETHVPRYNCDCFLFARPANQKGDLEIDGDIYTWRRRTEDGC